MASFALEHGCVDHWSWDAYDKSPDVRLYDENPNLATFHPNWSNGTAGIRGTKVLNYGRTYWEVMLPARVFGTSMMFGVGTVKARIHADAFVNLIGEDQQSWGLSHKGLLWHAGKSRQFTKPFHENRQTVIGMLFDWKQGTLSYYKDGISLGVAFTGLNRVDEELFPIASSTAAKTDMRLMRRSRSFYSLQDRCRATIIERVSGENDTDVLPIPTRIKEYINDAWYI